ncbi:MULTISPECIES: hypothetical protein [unclassified Rhizobium]|jgi:hypothetical protein|uniref:hypothetical protein n=1 Tax=unclassified Rhizobium TaxID=2613769 RepID=UPI000647BBB7|nr:MULTISPECIES: hypothetical protein [unclassified Rhizobium]MBN8953714.1 hypothetical protein [Rhizobium tropici]OJY77584.1 MAG: hypothetical protein BGP09_28445 [Rhizobium sp. 60-20]RKD56139.1 hypothetical protein BJ928_11168 [Rhizobium sp. WW_1]
MASRRERRFWWASLASLPVLLAANYAIDAWRNAEDYVGRNELRVSGSVDGQTYAKASWTLNQARLIGDGRDGKITFPGQMRLVVVRLAAKAEDDVGQSWTQCSLTLTDPKGRRWQPLNFILSNDLSRDLDPKATPIDGCDAISRQPPAKGASTIMEEKFVVPADAVPSLSAQLSFASTRPDAISFPLRLN